MGLGTDVPRNRSACGDGSNLGKKTREHKANMEKIKRRDTWWNVQEMCGKIKRTSLFLSYVDVVSVTVSVTTTPCAQELPLYDSIMHRYKWNQPNNCGSQVNLQVTVPEKKYHTTSSDCIVVLTIHYEAERGIEWKKRCDQTRKNTVLNILSPTSLQKHQ